MKLITDLMLGKRVQVVDITDTNKVHYVKTPTSKVRFVKGGLSFPIMIPKESNLPKRWGYGELVLTPDDIQAARYKAQLKPRYIVTLVDFHDDVKVYQIHIT